MTTKDNENKKTVYFDNSATTSLSQPAREAMTRAMDFYGNPSSLHTVGYEAHKLLENARGQVAAAFGAKNAKREQIIFTSSGTEASALAIFGSIMAKSRRVGNRILTTDCEHPSVEMAMKRLETQGFEICRIPTREGVLDLDFLETKLDSPIQLATFMMVNNETGARFEVEKAFSMVKERYPDAVTHCDAVQGFLKERFTPTTLGADLITVSAHKIHGPKGCGALYVSSDILKARKLTAYLVGGGQESGFRSGTENMIGICGFGAAAAEGASSLDYDVARMRELRAYAIELIGNDVKVNEPKGGIAPHILSITLPNIKSETMLHYLSAHGMCVSSGSACSSHAKTPSASLTAFGLDPKEADSTLRISFCKDNTREEVEAFAEKLKSGISTLVRIKR